MTRVPTKLPLTSVSVEETLRQLRPYMREVVEAADPEMLGAFDAAYDAAAADAAEEIINGKVDPSELSGGQALNIRGPVVSNVVAFMINVAASIAVAHVQAAHPDIWRWIMMQQTAPPASAALVGTDPVARLFALSEIPPDERARAEIQFRCIPALVQGVTLAPLA